MHHWPGLGFPVPLPSLGEGVPASESRVYGKVTRVPLDPRGRGDVRPGLRR